MSSTKIVGYVAVFNSMSCWLFDITHILPGPAAIDMRKQTLDVADLTSIQLVVCLMTGPKLLPKSVLHIV
jgi:hypothetical protein